MARIRLNPREVRATMNAFAARDAGRVARETERRAKELAGILVNVRTGRYRAGFKAKPGFSLRGPKWTVYNDVSYAPVIEEGSRPHVIRPRRAKALRFRVGGQVVYAKIVHHPGTKAQHVLARAVREVGQRNGYNVRITS